MLLNAETSNNQYHDIRNLAGAKFSTGCAGADIAGIGCAVDTGQQLSWNDAKAKCESMGMTLPDQGTLMNIAAQRANNPTLPQSGAFWSSSVYSSISALYVPFADNSTGAGLGGKTISFGVLCVE